MQQFDVAIFGKLKKLRTDYDAHAAATTGIHGAVSTATASKLVIRDANGRAQFADPAVDADVATRGWVNAGLATKGTVTSVGSGTGLTGGPITGSGSLSLANTAVTPATYTLATITVDAQGRITAASNGTGGVASVGASSPLASTGGANPSISIQASTAGQNGYMSSTDKAKLDGIASGAQVNAVTTVFGRTGAITADAGDYTVQKITGITVSVSSPSGGSNGDIWFKV